MLQQGSDHHLLSLPVLIGMIAAGVLTGGLAVHFLGGGSEGILKSDDDVIVRFLQDYPESCINAICYTEDRRSAFFELPNHSTGVVHSIGAKFLTRIFKANDLLEIREQYATKLHLHMDDFTWPAADFTFSDKQSRDQVYLWLTATKMAGSYDHD